MLRSGRPDYSSSLRLIARSLQLPEDTLVNNHDFNAVNESSGTYILRHFCAVADSDSLNDQSGLSSSEYLVEFVPFASSCSLAFPELRKKKLKQRTFG
jgi:hypothetical protein